MLRWGTTLSSVVRVAAWLAVVTIGILTLVPGELRPHMASSNQFEHVIAYLGTTGLLLLGYHARQRPNLIGLLMTAYAACLEIAQLFVPGRLSKFTDFAASALGIWLAIASFMIAERMFGRNGG
jgi:VanZ family protein